MPIYPPPPTQSYKWVERRCPFYSILVIVDNYLYNSIIMHNIMLLWSRVGKTIRPVEVGRLSFGHGQTTPWGGTDSTESCTRPACTEHTPHITIMLNALPIIYILLILYEYNYILSRRNRIYKTVIYLYIGTYVSFMRSKPKT